MDKLAITGLEYPRLYRECEVGMFQQNSLAKSQNSIYLNLSISHFYSFDLLVNTEMATEKKFVQKTIERKSNAINDLKRIS